MRDSTRWLDRVPASRSPIAADARQRPGSESDRGREASGRGLETAPQPRPFCVRLVGCAIAPPPIFRQFRLASVSGSAMNVHTNI